MIVEVANAWILALSGALVLRAARLRGWGLLPLGFILGICLEIGWGTVQAFAHLPGSPLLTWALCLGTGIGAWAWRSGRGEFLRLPWWPMAGVAATLVAAIALIRALRLYTWHIDSLEYIQQAKLLTRGHFLDTANAYVLDKRLIGFPLLEAPAQLSNGYVLFSVVPLLAVATLGALAWFVRVRVMEGFGRVATVGVVALSVVALASFNRFIANAWYVNGHLLAAALVLVAGGACWMLLDGSRSQAAPMAVVLALSAPALILVRPEGVFLVVVLLAPALASRRVALRTRRALAASTGAVMVVWFGFGAVSGFIHGDGGPPQVVITLVGFAYLALAATFPFLRPDGFVVSLLDASPRYIDAGLMILLGLLSLGYPDILTRSAHAVYRNAMVPDGTWGVSLDGLAILVVAAVFLQRGRILAPLRALTTTFLPIAFVLAFARGSAYRVAPVDSLNRMLIEVVPVAILFVVAVAAARPDSEGKRAQRSRSKVSEKA